MVQRSGTTSGVDLGVNNTYFYYLMSTANNGLKHNSLRKVDQTDSSDSIDSGTCSDNSQKTSPPPIQKTNLTTKVIINGNSSDNLGTSVTQINGNNRHYSDSEESESSLSSIGSSSVVSQSNDSHKMRFSLSYLPLPDSLLKDIRDHSMNTLKLNGSHSSNGSAKKSPSPAKIQLKNHLVQSSDESDSSQSSKITIKLQELSINGQNKNGKTKKSVSIVEHHNSIVPHHFNGGSKVNEYNGSILRNGGVLKNNTNYNNGGMNGRNSVSSNGSGGGSSGYFDGDLYRSAISYESDKYYNFHINEREVVEEEEETISNDDLDETFAGLKELKSGNSTIRSAKGTVRGVKNRVRNGIATFLQIQQHTTKVSATHTSYYLFISTHRLALYYRSLFSTN